MADIFGSKKQIIKKSDLDKAILKTNNKYKAKNKVLEGNIKSKESEIKSLNEEMKSLNNEIKSISKDVSNSKSLFSKENLKLNDMLSNMSKDIGDRKSHILTLKNEESSINKNVEKLNEEALRLNDDISYLGIKEKEKEHLIQDIAYFQKQKVLFGNELKNVKEERKSLEEEISNKQLFLEVKSKSYQNQIDKMEKEHKEFLEKIDAIKIKYKDAENNHKDLCVKIGKEHKDKSIELETIKSLVNKQEDEYIVWERKIENIQKSAKVEESRISQIKKNFKNWKISSLEEVARMKLKRKIENIDKAGLQEILNG